MGDEDGGKMDKYASERKRKRKKAESWVMRGNIVSKYIYRQRPSNHYTMSIALR